MRSCEVLVLTRCFLLADGRPAQLLHVAPPEEGSHLPDPDGGVREGPGAPLARLQYRRGHGLPARLHGHLRQNGVPPRTSRLLGGSAGR